MKHILALPTYQEICLGKELEQNDFGKFDLGHPVLLPNYIKECKHYGQKLTYDNVICAVMPMNVFDWPILVQKERYFQVCSCKKAPPSHLLMG